MSGWKTREVAKFPADAAVPVICTRARICDVLVVHNGDARIVTSHGRSVSVNLPSMPGWSGPSDAKRILAPERISVQGLSHSVSSRATAKTKDGVEIVLDLNYVPRSVAVNQILHAISGVLQEDQMMLVKLNVLARLRSHRRQSQGILHCVGEAILSSLGFESKVAIVDNSSWARLRDRANRDSRTDLKTTTIESNLPVELGKACSFFGRIASCFALPVLQALHAVAQEYLLQISRRDSLLQLVPTILTLATYLRLPMWIDYWQRQLPTATHIDVRFPGESIYPVHDVSC